MATIAHLITGLQTGGAERMLSLVAARLDRRRFRSVVVSMTDRGAIAATLDRVGIEIRSLGMTPGVPDPRGLFRLVRILREIRPDILQTWLYHADFMGLMAYRLGCAPHLLWNIRCSDMSGVALGGISSVLRWMLSRQSTSPDAIVVNSRTGQQFLESIGYRPRRWELLPNGFDTCELRPDLDTRQRFRTGLALSDDHFNRLARALSPHERSRYVSGRRRPPRRDQNPGSLSVGRKRGRRGQPRARTLYHQPRNLGPHLVTRRA